MRLRGAIAIALTSACAKDVVLPDMSVEPVCGNGVLEPGEACDLRSPGCVSCAVVPTWTCDTAGCAPVCGDGVVGGGAACGAPRRDTDCDLGGYWAARATDYTRDAILGAVQTSSNWYLFRFEQRGGALSVAEELDCGVHVTGSETVDSTPGTMRGVLYLNRMDGGGSRPARGGASNAAPGGCSIALDRWYSIRGAAEALLPGDFLAKPPLASLPPLPSVADPVAGHDEPAGATDPDGDGIPGVAFALTGIVSGTRNSAQRDWREYASAAPAIAGALAFTVPGRFDLEEHVLRVTGCGSGCALGAAGAMAAQDVSGYLAFAFIGRELGGVRTSQVVARKPREDLDADLTTCARVRRMLPHDPSKPGGT